MLVVGAACIPIIFLITVASHYYNHEDHVTKDLPAVLSFGRMPTWIKRVQDFMYADKEDASYQVQQAKIAIATGGIFGKGPGKSEETKFFAASLQRFYLCNHYRRIRACRRSGDFTDLSAFFIPKYKAFSRMSVRFWSIPGSGAQLYFGDTGVGEYGGECKPVSYNRRDLTSW